MAIERGSFTPPPSFNSRPSHAPKSCNSENRKNYSSPFNDRFHVVHKVPAGDSPYVRAKRAQLIDKDPTRSISLFWRAINSGDRVDSALKDMAVVMKQLDRSDEAIEAIMSFRHLCSTEAQESLDNILIELYKRSGRLEEQVEVLQEKLKRIEEEASIGGKKTKMARSQGKKIHITAEQEYSRLLGNLAWAHLQQNNFKVAEEYYRKGLSIELDRNKQCNLAICLMHMNRINEAKLLLQSIKLSVGNQQMDDSYSKSYERAHELLDQIESQGGLHPFGKENHREQERDFECQSQADYIDNMCTLGNANKSGSVLRTPVVSKWKTGAKKDGSFPDCMEESPAQHLYTQPINRKQTEGTKTAAPLSIRGYSRSPSTQPKRYSMILGSGVKENELDGENNRSRSCNLQFKKKTGDLEVIEVQKPNTNSENSSAGSPNECNTNCSDSCNGDNAEQAKDFFFPSWSWKSGKSWADMAEEEDSLDYTFDSNRQPPFLRDHSNSSSNNASVCRSLSFDHEEKQDLKSNGLQNQGTCQVKDITPSSWKS